MSIPAFAFNTTARIVFGEGTSDAICDIAGSLVGERVILITDPGLRRLDLCGPAIAGLEAAGIAVTIFDSVEADPSLAIVEAASAMARAHGATGVIGFGGGSSLDVAKVVALLAGSQQPIEAAWGVGKASGPRLPLVVVPTTAGTGSEVTPIAIITMPDGEKRGISSQIIIPDLAILDPLLTLGLPGPVTAATGIDAMVHAIEGYASANPNNNPVSRALAREALRLLGANIETAVFNGSDKAARGSMLLGSMLAGQAFANSPVAAVHALAYPIGGSFKVPHGLSNALVLPHVLRFNAPMASAIYAELAPEAFPDLLALEGAEARCDAFIEALSALAARLGLQTRLRDVGIGKGDLDKMAADAMKQTRLLVNNPREVTQADALAIYEAAW
ncbi:MAG: alcohol dehydrogenase [Pelagibacterium sp. SCN 64-44]|nr:MAG: alcohol dehydrogenase [Pelagibacterium sp. SCN 64-44]